MFCISCIYCLHPLLLLLYIVILTLCLQRVMVLTSLTNYENIPMPELLASLTGRTGSITLGYREKLGQSQSAQQRTKSVSRQSVSELEGKENAEDDLDLTGSPLGADFDPDQQWEVFCPEVDNEDGGRETANL